MKRVLKDLLWYILGCLIYSSAITMLISVNEISPGGFTGIATAINYLSGFSSGVILLILNIPVLIIGFLKFGKEFIIKTAVATVLLSLSLTFTDLVLPSFKIDKILAAVFGGIMMGLGLSIVLLHGATTGGVDIIAKLINNRFRHFIVGRIILISDSLVILFAVFCYRNVEIALYSVISIYASSKIMDRILYGGDRGKIIYIVTNSAKDICGEINRKLKRGVTVLKATGAFTGQEHSLLFFTVRIHEVSAVYEIIDKYDENAFVVVADVGEIIGEGFKMLEKPIKK